MASKVNVPVDLDRPKVMAGFLADIGLPLPEVVAFSGVEPTLRASGRTFTIPQIDDALDKAKISLSERLHIKTAMCGHRLVVR
jgi:hypothetical protein